VEERAAAKANRRRYTSKREKMKVAKILEGKEASTRKRKMTEPLKGLSGV
jgi:hypothetical protein